MWPLFAVAALVAVAALAIYAYGAGYLTGEAPVSMAEPSACTVADIRRLTVDRRSATRVIAKSPDYTQGLIFTDGWLYESTGKVGQSAVYRLDPSGGPRTKLTGLDSELFGEGLARIDDRFYQLTWQAGLAFAYELDRDGGHLNLVSTYSLDGEGWGLTVIGSQLVLSDGSDKLLFIEPETFNVNRLVPVRLGDQPVGRLNELELARGEVLANVYGDSAIVGIEPSSGCVRTVIDASRLVAEMAGELNVITAPVCTGPCTSWDFVINGIAYDPDTDEIYLTGKNWPLIFVYRGLIG